MAQRKNARQGRRAPAYSADSMAVRLVIGLLLIALGLLMFLSLIMGMPGDVFTGVRQVSRGLAGGLAFLLPVFPVWGGGLLLFSVQRRVPMWPFLMACALYILLLTIALLLTYTGSPAIPVMEYFHLVNRSRTAKPNAYTQFLSRAYEQGASTGKSGGMLGMLLAWPLWRMLGAVPGAVAAILLAIVAVMAMFRLTPARITELAQQGSAYVHERWEARQQEQYKQELLWQQEQARLEQEEQARLLQQQAWEEQQNAQPAPQPQHQQPSEPQPQAQPQQPMAHPGYPKQGQEPSGHAPQQGPSGYAPSTRPDAFPQPTGLSPTVRASGQPGLVGNGELRPRRTSIFGNSAAQAENEVQQAETPKRRGIFNRGPEESGPKTITRRTSIFGAPVTEEVVQQPSQRLGIFNRGRKAEPELPLDLPTEEPGLANQELPSPADSWPDNEADEYRPLVRKPRTQTQRQPALRRQQPAEAIEPVAPAEPPVGAAYAESASDAPARAVGRRQAQPAEPQQATGLHRTGRQARVAQQAAATRVPQKPLDSWADTPPWEDGPVPETPEEVVTPVLQNSKPQGAWEADLKLPPRRDVPAAQSSSAPEMFERAQTAYELEPIPYVYPSLTLIKPPEPQLGINAEEDAIRSQRLEETLKSFRVPAKVRHITHGPAISRFELELAAGIKVNKVTDLNRNIAMNMEVKSVRIEAPIPGKSLVGVEVPNARTATVTLREVLESDAMRSTDKPLVVALGKDIAGVPVLCDLARMPHLLIAGATGSGKSVCINTIINSLLFRCSPEEVRLILIDPKVVELQCYNGIPHLLIPVVSDPHKASGALAWAVGEMMDRYKQFERKGVRAIDGYNAALEEGETAMPRIVIIIDELADLMMTCKKDVEDRICRIAQLARAAGIHLIVATQRPSVDVITGIIKANIPSRIAFKVSSAIDSRTILDKIGAEQLLGYGDMLYQPTGEFTPIRVQGCFLTDGEVNRVTDFIRDNCPADYDPGVLEQLDRLEREAEGFSTPDPESSEVSDGDSSLLGQAIEMAVNDGQVSTSLIQRRLKIGYARAGRLVDEMEKRGIVSQKDGAKPRLCLISRDEYEQMRDNGELD